MMVFREFLFSPIYFPRKYSENKTLAQINNYTENPLFLCVSLIYCPYMLITMPFIVSTSVKHVLVGYMVEVLHNLR